MRGIFRKRFLCVPVLGFVVVSVGACSPSANRNEDLTSAGIPVRVQEQGGMSFEELQKEYKDIIAAFPLKTHSEPVMAMLVEAALREKIAPDKKALMKLHADGSIGLFLFELECADALAKKPDEALAFLDRTRKELPGTSVARLALDKELALRSKDHSDELLSACDQILGQGDDREKAIALLRRAEYHALGNPKKAALDFLQFWSLYPAKVPPLGLSLKIMSCLKDAGLYWEATALEVSSSPETLAKAFYGELKAAMDSPGEQPSSSLVAAYMRNTPDLQTLLDIADKPADATLENAAFLGRVGCLAMYVDNPQAAKVTIRRCGEELVSLFPGPTARETTYLIQLDDCVRTATHDFLRVFSNYSMRETSEEKIEYNFGAPDVSDLARALAKEGYELAVELVSRDGGGQTTRIENAVETCRKVAAAVNDRRMIVETFENVVNRFPDTPLAPAYLVKIGDLYKDVWKAPEKAAESYSRVRKQYPSAPQAAQAHMKEAVCLYEAEKYQDAYLVCQEFIVQRPGTDEVVGAKLLSALSEAAMGSTDESEGHLRELAESYPTNPLAAHALYMVGSSRLAKQDYKNASVVFRDLIERYPGSSYAEKARSYVERLSSVAATSGK